MKKYLSPLILMLTAVVVLVIANQFSYIDAQGFLHEPGFFVTPFALLLFVGGAPLGLWRLVRGIITRIHA